MPYNKRKGFFSLNLFIRAPVNNGIIVSAKPGNSTNITRISGLLRTKDSLAASVLITVLSLGIWLTNNNISVINNSIWVTGILSPGARPLRISFSGRATRKEISRGVVLLLITYYYIIKIL